MTGLLTDILRVMILVVEESQTRPLAATVWRCPSARLEMLTRDLNSQLVFWHYKNQYSPARDFEVYCSIYL